LHLWDVAVQELLADEGLGPVEWGVYIAVWETQPESVTQLTCRTGMSRTCVTRACRKLEQAGWLALSACGPSLRPVALIPRRCQELLAKNLVIGYESAPYKGEYLMKRCLDLLVASSDYLDNARLGFLTNPATKEALEYDRFYTLGVAFEFNGPQHYEKTRLYSGDRSLRETQARDLIKKGLSLNHQVKLITITVDQLHPTVIQSLLPAILPRRPVDPDGYYYQALVKNRTSELSLSQVCRGASGEETEPLPIRVSVVLGSL
jgi:hypothetical protein